MPQKRNCNAFPEFPDPARQNAPENSYFQDFRTFAKITRPAMGHNQASLHKGIP
jgi:hypothetical protein